jgi:hypothetical protein
MLGPVLVALVVGLVVAGVWLWTRNRGALVLAISWLSYAGYEFLMYRRILCTGECNIRVDLLLIYPALLGASAVILGKGLADAIRSGRRGRK